MVIGTGWTEKESINFQIGIKKFGGNAKAIQSIVKTRSNYEIQKYIEEFYRKKRQNIQPKEVKPDLTKKEEVN